MQRAALPCLSTAHRTSLVSLCQKGPVCSGGCRLSVGKGRDCGHTCGLPPSSYGDWIDFPIGTMQQNTAKKYKKRLLESADKTAAALTGLN